LGYYPHHLHRPPPELVLDTWEGPRLPPPSPPPLLLPLLFSPLTASLSLFTLSSPGSQVIALPAAQVLGADGFLTSELKTRKVVLPAGGHLHWGVGLVGTKNARLAGTSHHQSRYTTVDLLLKVDTHEGVCHAPVVGRRRRRVRRRRFLRPPGARARSSDVTLRSHASSAGRAHCGEGGEDVGGYMLKGRRRCAGGGGQEGKNSRDRSRPRGLTCGLLAQFPAHFVPFGTKVIWLGHGPSSGRGRELGQRESVKGPFPGRSLSNGPLGVGALQVQ
jgi:hypothetical protein